MNTIYIDIRTPKTAEKHFHEAPTLSKSMGSIAPTAPILTRTLTTTTISDFT